MVAFFGGLITTFIYQPFFNLLVYIYLILDKMSQGQADMGWAVIIFTIIFRIILLPLSLKGERSEKEKWDISQKIDFIENQYRADPIQKKAAIRKLLSSNRKILSWEVFDLLIQVLVALMLYRIFTTGLEGTDFHLLYPFLAGSPSLSAGPTFNLMFLAVFDLSKPNFIINLINTLVIFVAEFLSIRFSPFPMSKSDKSMLVVLPLAAFTFFAFMPSGKKLFVTTTLLFSIGLILAKRLVYLYHSLGKSGKSQAVKGEFVE